MPPAAEVLTEEVADADAGPARDDQEHALPLRGIEGGQAAEPQSKLRPVGARGIDRHLNAGTLRVRYVAARRPAHGGGARKGLQPSEGERGHQEDSANQGRSEMPHWRSLLAPPPPGVATAHATQYVSPVGHTAGRPA